jgi:DNA-binding NtrC family response regulator
MKRVLLVGSQTSDDGARERLEADGFQVVECSGAEQAIERFKTGVDAVVLLEPVADAVGLLHELRAIDSSAPMIVVSSSPSDALNALREGADYVVKPPLSLEEVSLLTRRALGEDDSAVSRRPTARPETGEKKAVDYELPSQGIDFRELEREVLTQALRLASGNQTRAASLLGLTRDQVRYRMAKFGMTGREAGRGAQAA